MKTTKEIGQKNKRAVKSNKTKYENDIIEELAADGGNIDFAARKVVSSAEVSGLVGPQKGLGRKVGVAHFAENSSEKIEEKLKAAPSYAKSKDQNTASGKTENEQEIKEEYFIIHPETYENPEETSIELKINFIVYDRKKIDDVPDNLLELYVLCEEAYSVIKAMPIIAKPDKKKTERKNRMMDANKRQAYEENKNKIRNKYISDLHDIAQVGLEGKAPQPKLAKKSLNKLKEEILMKEGGKIKNRHFVELGIKALILGVIVAVLGCVFMQLAEGAFGSASFLINNNIYPYLFIFAGAMAGTWVSFGVRNLDMTFRDLAIMEEDMLKSFPRLFFVGVVSIIFMLFVESTIITFDIGGIGTSDIMGSIELQILVGVVAGLLGNKLATGLYGKAKDAVKTGEDK